MCKNLYTLEFSISNISNVKIYIYHIYIYMGHLARKEKKLSCIKIKCEKGHLL